jgi:hypothetical protein
MIPVYGDNLRAFPMPLLSFPSHVNGHALESLYTGFAIPSRLELYSHAHMRVRPSLRRDYDSERSVL